MDKVGGCRIVFGCPMHVALYGMRISESILMKHFYILTGILIVTSLSVVHAIWPTSEMNSRIDNNLYKPLSLSQHEKPAQTSVEPDNVELPQWSEQQTIANTIPSFRLLGITLANSGNTAIMQINDSPEKIVYEADYCIEDWKLLKVLNNKVIVSNGQQALTIPLTSHATQIPDKLQVENLTDKEITKLDRYIDAELVIKAAHLRMQDSEFKKKIDIYIDGRRPAEVPYPMGVTSYGVTKLAVNRYEIERDAIAEQVQQSHVYLHTEFSLENEQLSLDRIVPGSLFDKAGLLPGDRILSVNDQILNSANPLMLYQQLLYGEEQLNVRIVRDGEELEMGYFIK